MPVYPLDTKDTFSYWAPINGNLITFTTNLAEAPIGKAIAEATGVKVNYIHPTESQAEEQFNLLLASSKLRMCWSTTGVFIRVDRKRRFQTGLSYR